MAFRHAPGTDHPFAGLYEVEGEIVSDARPKAVLFKVTGGNRCDWLPRKAIRVQRGEGARAVVGVPQWLAKEKGYV